MRRGLTLVEVLVAAMIAMLVLTAATALYVSSARGFNKATESYEIEHILEDTVSWIRRDLQQTNIGSVVSYPNDNADGEEPAFSFISCSKIGEAHQMHLSRFGTPDWQKHVFYHLQKANEGDNVRKLIRSEIPATAQKDWSVMPLPSQILPSALQAENSRVITQAVLAPGHSLGSDNTGVAIPVKDAGKPGGLQLSFIRADGSLNSNNPVGPKADGATPLIQVDLCLVVPKAVKWSSLRFSFRVAPRN